MSFSSAPDLWFGIANAWECDELGHLNIQVYAKRAVEAFAALMDEIGAASPLSSAASAIARPRLLHCRYLREARPGDRLAIHGGLTHCRTQELGAALEMRGADGQPMAGFLIDAEHMDLKTQRIFGWPKRVTQHAEAVIVEAPDHVRPRGIDETTVESLARAHDTTTKARSPQRIGKGVFHADEASADGHISMASLIGRLSDCNGFLYRPALDAADLNHVDVAQLELRLHMHAWPQPGDGFELTSSITGVTGKTVSAQHCFQAPRNGPVWARVATVGAFFDVNQRRAVSPPSGVVQQLSKRAAEPV